MNKIFFSIFFLLIQFFIFPADIHANQIISERINFYFSHVTVNPDGSLLVKEEIDVMATGDKIKRGIYRDYPTIYKTNFGLVKKVGFEIISIEKNNSPELYSTQKMSNGIRIYIGDSNVYIPKGNYRYAITYKTNRQLGYFKDFDELYYNITGNGWEFPIDKAAVTVVLPSTIKANEVNAWGYTGKQGSKNQDVKISSDNIDGTHVYVETTKLLGINEGLTIAVNWPKGIIKKPTVFENYFNFFKDNFLAFFGLIVSLGVGLYYFLIWSKYGKDPQGTRIITLFNPPKDISPAIIRYIHRMGFDDKVLTVSLISMAIKGYVKIIEKTSTFSVEKITKNDSKLATDEKNIAASLFPDNVKNFTFSASNYQKVNNLISSVRKFLDENNKEKYFKKNYKYLILPVIMSLLFVLISIIYFQPLVIIFILAQIILHVVYISILKTWTILGRSVEDQIEGFKKYLLAVEERRYELDKLSVPEKLSMYEKYFPYAVALDIEPQWTKQFDQTLKSLTPEEQNTYLPWYSGHSLGSSSLCNSLNSTISSSSTPPGSSSGSGGFSGGGSSGGGGGGGGGGGW